MAGDAPQPTADPAFSTSPPPPAETPSSEPRAPAPPAGPASPCFHLFPHFPAELRLKIWHHSFEGRVVELHGRRAHYAEDHSLSGVPVWQSRCFNPAALSVNVEARAAALEHYTVRIPLAMGAPFERAGDSVADLHRVLYISPASDTVVTLGDVDIRRLSSLLADLQRRDPRGDGLRRLAISARWASGHGAGGMLRVFAKTIFRNLDELVFFMFEEHTPPADWAGGTCWLDDCSGTDYYRRYAMGKGQELKEGTRWMVVGKSEVRVVDLKFRNGW